MTAEAGRVKRHVALTTSLLLGLGGLATGAALSQTTSTSGVHTHAYHIGAQANRWRTLLHQSPHTPLRRGVHGLRLDPKSAVDYRRIRAVEVVNGHDAGTHDPQKGSIGTPTTVVYADTLSQPAIIAGIRRGRVFIDVAGARMNQLGQFTWHSDGGRHWLRINVRDPDGHLALVGNPIYLTAGGADAAAMR